MKLFITVLLREFRKDIDQVFLKSGIHVFSVSDTTGFKDDRTFDLTDSWFSSGTEPFDSLVFFSFTSAENAQKALALINEYNNTNDTGYPVRGFVIPVEAWSERQ